MGIYGTEALLLGLLLGGVLLGEADLATFQF